MVLFEDRLHELVRYLVEKGELSPGAWERLPARGVAEWAGDATTQGTGPLEITRRGRAKIGRILQLCGEGLYGEAWRVFVELERDLTKHGWMGLLDGDVYRLGAFLARRVGNWSEADRLDEQYAAYRARYVDSFRSFVVRSVEGLWGQSDRVAELEELLTEGSPVEDGGDWLRAWLGQAAERVRWAVGSIGQLAPPAAVVAAGQGAGREEVGGEAEGVRWKVVREEDGGVWVWVETEEPGVEKVAVLVGGEGEAEPVVRVEVRVVEVGAGRYGGMVFVGRWEDLGLGESAVVVLGAERGS